MHYSTHVLPFLEKAGAGANLAAHKVIVRSVLIAASGHSTPA